MRQATYIVATIIVLVWPHSIHAQGEYLKSGESGVGIAAFGGFSKAVNAYAGSFGIARENNISWLFFGGTSGKSGSHNWTSNFGTGIQVERRPSQKKLSLGATFNVLFEIVARDRIHYKVVGAGAEIFLRIPVLSWLAALPRLGLFGGAGIYKGKSAVDVQHFQNWGGGLSLAISPVSWSIISIGGGRLWSSPGDVRLAYVSLALIFVPTR